MSDIVIKAENLGKKYIIGHQSERGSYTALRDVLMQNARTLLNKTKDLATGKPIIQGDTLEDVWALKDVNFEIRRGEAVGIIGRNGAGKSTLLKILSRITEPSSGRVTIKGRVASLLEVGTGFHPELSGRENIYLNGTILGMTRSEIKQKFDEIVAFAEVEKYLDTPVKRYSSGMYVRLAFAVAAHLEPEVLVVDEVLAVGDSQFQKKCLGKMQDIGNTGRTILFVSHNMAAIQSLCNIGILLNNGEIIVNGKIAPTMHQYNKLLSVGAEFNVDLRRGVRVTDITIISVNNEKLIADSSMDVAIQLSTSYVLPNCYLNLVIEDSESRVMIHTRTDLFDIYPTLEPGNHNILVQFGRISLRAGIYSLWFRLYCNTSDTYELIDSDRIMLEVLGTQVGGALDIPCQWIIDGNRI